MFAVIGLGNPEPPYAGTRHNAGASTVSVFQQLVGAPELQLQKKSQTSVSKTSQIVIGKPATYMNESGQAVRAVLDYYQIEPENLYLIFDDLDLELGQHKIQFATGPKVHNGLLSVYQHLGTQNFWHVRIGVDSRGADRRINPSEYVLQRFLTDEQSLFKQTQVRVADELKQRLLATPGTLK